MVLTMPINVVSGNTQKKFQVRIFFLCFYYRNAVFGVDVCLASVFNQKTLD